MRESTERSVLVGTFKDKLTQVKGVLVEPDNVLDQATKDLDESRGFA